MGEGENYRKAFKLHSGRSVSFLRSSSRWWRCNESEKRRLNYELWFHQKCTSTRNANLESIWSHSTPIIISCWICLRRSLSRFSALSTRNNGEEQRDIATNKSNMKVHHFPFRQVAEISTPTFWREPKNEAKNELTTSRSKDICTHVLISFAFSGIKIVFGWFIIVERKKECRLVV